MCPVSLLEIQMLWSAQQGSLGEVISKLLKHRERDFPFRKITLVSRDEKERTAEKIEWWRDYSKITIASYTGSKCTR